MSELRYIFKFFVNPLDSNLKLSRLIEFAESVSSFFNTGYSKVYYSTHWGTKSKTKSKKYTQDIIEQLTYVDGTITTLSFEKHKKYNYTADTDISMSLSISDKESFPSTINISIDPILFTAADYEASVMDFIKICLSFGFCIYSGGMHIIEEKKFPMIFLNGLKNPVLNQEERDMDDALCLNISEYKQKIWDVFLLNIVTKDMIDDTMLRSIATVVNDDNTLEFGDKLLIRLPVSFDEYFDDQDKTSMYKNKLRRIFAEEGKIMYKI